MAAERIILAGGSGLLGGALARHWGGKNVEIVVLSRRGSGQEGSRRFAQWDGRTVGGWARELEGARAVVNLAGRSLDCRFTAANRKEILESRVDSARAIAVAAAGCANPPRVVVQVSAVGYYGDTGERVCDENCPAGQGFLADVCRQWEEASGGAAVASRRVVLRIGVVLTREGGALPVLAKLARWFLGGAAGSGRQYVSWIHVADLVRMVEWAVEREEMEGAFNAVAARPVTNGELMAELRGAMGRPWAPPAPAPLVRAGAWLMGRQGELALTSQRCEPGRFLEKGFEFQFPEIRSALENLLK